MPVQLGVLTSVLGNADEGVRGSVRGFVSLAGGIVDAYVKVVPPREIAVECVCALLARQLNLEAPEPLIVFVPAALSGTAADSLAFGCITVSHGNLRPWFAQIGDSAMKRRLRAWTELVPAACFDEWIANHDRHGGNILYDGRDRFWLIDHGMAVAQELSVETAVKNILFDVAVEGLSDQDMTMLKPKALGVMENFAEQTLFSILDEIPLGLWDPTFQQAVGIWLNERQAHLLRLAGDRVPTNQGNFIFDKTHGGH